MRVKNPYFEVCAKDVTHPYYNKPCDENCPDAEMCKLGELVDPKLLSKSKLEEVLYELSELEFKEFDEVEEFMDNHFDVYDEAELPNEDELGFLVCHHICYYRLLIVFKYEDGVWRFNRIERTAYVDSKDENF